MKKLDKNKKRKYSISEYDPNWITKFESIKSFLEKIFGDRALRIEHIGSTSIPNMKAKPVIDVLIVVEDVKDLSQEILGMEQAGYQYGENYIAPNTLTFIKTDSGEKKLENIHVCELHAPKVKQFLVMRDFLRAFPKKAKEYSNLKEKYFNDHPDNYPAYRAAKDPFLRKLEKEAYEWEENKDT